jgi:CHRD domain
MRKHAIVALALLSLAAPASSDEGSEKKLSAALNGVEEIPGPGDPDGAGSFKGMFNPEREEVCYSLNASKIQAPNAAHIHRGAKGAEGPVVVSLKPPPVESGVEACTKVVRALATEILQKPGDFYVNVHNPDFPRGAVRGQLSK